MENGRTDAGWVQPLLFVSEQEQKAQGEVKTEEEGGILPRTLRVPRLRGTCEGAFS